MKKTEIFLDTPVTECSRCATVGKTLGKFVFWHPKTGYEEHEICLECYKKVKEYLGIK